MGWCLAGMGPITCEHELPEVLQAGGLQVGKLLGKCVCCQSAAGTTWLGVRGARLSMHMRAHGKGQHACCLTVS